MKEIKVAEMGADERRAAHEEVRLLERLNNHPHVLRVVESFEHRGVRSLPLPPCWPFRVRLL